MKRTYASLLTLLLSGASLPIMAQDYPLNIEETANASTATRYVNNITLISPSAGEQIIQVGSADPQRIYRSLLNQSFVAKAGETVIPNINFNGSWMNGYIYLDKGQDGTFEWELNDDYTAPEGSDLVSYYYIETVENQSGFNYKGEAVSGTSRNTMQTPAFQIPADLEPGFYRMRFKVDWGNADPGGRNTETNSIIQNSGSIVDIRLNIHEDLVTVNTQAQDGELQAADGTALTGKQVKFGEALTIKMVSSEGFKPDGITLTHGYNLAEDSLIHGTPQFTTVRIPGYVVKEDGTLTIPAELVDGDLQIIGHFKSTDGSEGETGNYDLNFPKELEINRPNNDRVLNSFSLTGNMGCAFSSNIPEETNHLVYQDRTSEVAMVKPGESITPSVNYTTEGPMHGYFYLDLNQDGIFDYEIGADHRPTASSEILSYSYLDGFNSLGEEKDMYETNNAITFPSFTVSEFIPAGIYRARLKIDWDNADPKGNYAEDAGNKISDNGGYVVDFLVNISDGEKTLSVDVMNGNVYGENNTALPYNLGGTTELKAVFKPVTEDYTLSTPVYIQSGINLDGPQYIRGNQQWYADTIQAADITDAPVTIPVFGDVKIKTAYEADANAEYRMVFNDEFNGQDGEAVDAEKWRTSQRMSSTWNRFISDSIAVAHIEDGKLALKAIPNLDKSKDNVDMLTGAVETRNKFSFKYGLVECRAKTNGYTGNFPAIWMMPQDQSAGWPNCGEIDIFEQIDAEAKSYHTIHSNWTYNLGNKNNPQSTFNKNLNMDTYHTYGFEWNENTLIWYVDGVKVGQYTKSTSQDALNKGQWPFDKEFYLILNQSVGNGSWARPADINHTYRMDVDWIRVYQKESQISTDIDETESNRFSIKTANNQITVSTNDEAKVMIADISGSVIFNGVIKNTQTFSVHKGIYIVNNQKVMVP